MELMQILQDSGSPSFIASSILQDFALPLLCWGFEDVCSVELQLSNAFLDVVQGSEKQNRKECTKTSFCCYLYYVHLSVCIYRNYIVLLSLKGEWRMTQLMQLQKQCTSDARELTGFCSRLYQHLPVGCFLLRRNLVVFWKPPPNVFI